MSTKLLKNTSLWAVVVPVLLVVWLSLALAKMHKMRKQVLQQKDITRQVQKNVDKILELYTKIGRSSIAGNLQGNFEGVTSALVCARKALIPEDRLTRLESSKPQRQKDQSILHRETYKLSGVGILKIYQFIDHAERNFSFMRCTQLSLTKARSKSKDNWDATISFQYFEK